MMVEVLRCRYCGTIIVVDIKKLWCTKACSACESRDIEKYDFNEEDKEENK